MFSGLKQQLQKTGAALPIPGLRREQPAQRPGRAVRTAPAEGRLTRFIRETKSELKKVTWPTREQATRLTGIVIAVSAAVGLVMGGIDFLFEKIVQLSLR